ncbi:MAG TPA: hypothetical protein ENK18_07325 [Deltaproteobacteria bacterium]|nr:hypothetical protein [Deltaproteobacteria bacterium]
MHVLRHPEHGTFVIDTGVDAQIAAGERGGTRGLVRSFLKALQHEVTPELPSEGSGEEATDDGVL